MKWAGLGVMAEPAKNAIYTHEVRQACDARHRTVMRRLVQEQKNILAAIQCDIEGLAATARTHNRREPA